MSMMEGERPGGWQSSHSDDPRCLPAITYMRGLSSRRSTRKYGTSRVAHVSSSPLRGPYICFYGSVLTDTFIVQPFVACIFLGGDPAAGECIKHIAKIFAEFLDQFDYPGCRRRRPWKYSMGDCQLYLFRAKTAQKCLSSSISGMESGLTASLQSTTRRLHLRCTLVFLWTAWREYHWGSLSASVIYDVETALTVLGRKGVVHGDVRRPNVVLIDRADGKTGGMLIDFDWADQSGEYSHAVFGGDSDVLSATSEINQRNLAESYPRGVLSTHNIVCT
ncbi:hypothetical protein BD414DRAFT_531637 [Trametes punicea]|nr:hypothetical protein BD414DRAFT_531637 [Trametes punicea]